MKRYFLGMAAGYSTRQVWRHTFAWGQASDLTALEQYLQRRYTGSDPSTKAILCKNGRSALALTLKAYFDPGDKVLVNGFTCYAVYEAVKAAGLTPVWVDISREDLNFDLDSLNKVVNTQAASAGDGLGRVPAEHPEGGAAGGKSPAGPAERIKGIIIQNSLGNPVDIKKVENFAKKHGLTIIEDLAHCTGIKYPDGREAGTVGAAAVFSFGKDKMIDTISGGAVVLRHPCRHQVTTPSRPPHPSDYLRARFYPFFGTLCRGLTGIHFGGILMRGLVKLHWVERSADNKLDLTRKLSKFEAKLALEQFKKLKKSGQPPLRSFYLVRDRKKVLKELQQAGYYFHGLWYERPVSPERYYQKVHFPEAECPIATEVAANIINFPTYYHPKELASARSIIREHLKEAR